MRAAAEFDAPAEISVTITLTGPLSDFEALAKEVENPTNNYSVTKILRLISDASYKLRQRVLANGEA